MGEEMLISAEDSVMANFDFLSREEDIDDEDEVRGNKIYDVFMEISWIYNIPNMRRQFSTLMLNFFSPFPVPLLHFLPNASIIRFSPAASFNHHTIAFSIYTRDIYYNFYL